MQVPRRSHAPNKSRNGLPRRVFDCRYPAGTGAAGECAVVPTGNAIEESVDLAYEIFNRVFRKVPENMEQAKR
jgi:hypothetical protein